MKRVALMVLNGTAQAEKLQVLAIQAAKFCSAMATEWTPFIGKLAPPFETEHLQQPLVNFCGPLVNGLVLRRRHVLVTVTLLRACILRLLFCAAEMPQHPPHLPQ